MSDSGDENPTPDLQKAVQVAKLLVCIRTSLHVSRPPSQPCRTCSKVALSLKLLLQFRGGGVSRKQGFLDLASLSRWEMEHRMIEGARLTNQLRSSSSDPGWLPSPAILEVYVAFRSLGFAFSLCFASLVGHFTQGAGECKFELSLTTLIQPICVSFTLSSLHNAGGWRIKGAPKQLEGAH